jgi:hypothetical protein
MAKVAFHGLPRRFSYGMRMRAPRARSCDGDYRQWRRELFGVNQLR